MKYCLGIGHLLKAWMFFSITIFSGITARATIVIDHNCTDYRKIPSYFIEEIKGRNMLVQSLGESHGSQIYHGLLLLEAKDERFSVQIDGNLDELNEGNALRVVTSQFQNLQWSGESFGDEKYWSSEDAMVLTETSARQAIYQDDPIDVSLWIWCWDMCRPESFFSQANYFDDSHINMYLNAIWRFNDNDKINRSLFVYVTSVSDCSSNSNPDGPWRVTNYGNIIRQKAMNDNAVLFDQADIENWNIDNTEQYSYVDGSGREVYLRHGDYAEANVPDSYFGDHANDALCIRKGTAIWWLLARFLGWDGEYVLEGDINDDGRVDVEDLEVFYTCWLNFNCQEPDWCSGSDLDQNGMVNMFDYTKLAQEWMEMLIVAGDMDGDRKITFQDLREMSLFWLNEGCRYPDFCGGGDVDKDGKVDLFDFSMLAENWMVLSGDFNCDFEVDFEDFNYICQHWLESEYQSANWSDRVDINHDLIVNFLDMSVLAGNWLK